MNLPVDILYKNLFLYQEGITHCLLPILEMAFVPEDSLPKKEKPVLELKHTKFVKQN